MDSERKEPATLGDEWLAGAVGGAAIAGGAVAGPLWGTVFDLVSAAAAAAITARVVDRAARNAGACPAASARLLHRAAREATRREGAPLAAHAVAVWYRARSGDSRALRSAAILVGRATAANACGLVSELFRLVVRPASEVAA